MVIKNTRKRFLAMMLVVMMLLSLVPMDILASVNHGTGLGNNTSTGKGTEAWQYPGESAKPYGMRMSIYWAPSLADFENGVVENISKIGNLKEYTTYNPQPKYYTQHSTGRSVVDYMTLGKDLKINHHTWVDGGYHRGIGGNISDAMPSILTASAKEWKIFFEGKDYETNPEYTRMEEISEDLGQKITAEDFKKGIRRDAYGNTQQGIYKLFFEPVVYAIIGGYNSAFTFRDMAVWEQKFMVNRNIKDVADFYYVASNDSDIARHYLNIIPNTGNSHFLEKEEKTLGMIGKPAGLRIPATSDGIRKAVAKGTDSWLSMGVGVVTPDTPKGPKTRMIVSYVQVVDFKDGKFIYETIKDTEEEEVRYQEGQHETGFIDIDVVRHTSAGYAVSNDVITTKTDTILLLKCI